jgi:hypothetical protein
LEKATRVSEAEAEASNKLYVALSRARKHLVLYERKDAWKAQCAPAILKAGHLFQRVQGVAKAQFTAVQATAKLQDFLVGPIAFSGFLTYRVCPRRYYYEEELGLNPATGMHPAAAIEAAAMRDLFVPYGDDAAASSEEVERVLSNLGGDFKDALPHLRAYADRLLASGRRWLGCQRAVMAQPFDVNCDGLTLRLSPHRISGSDKVLAIEFVRTRPAGKVRRQQSSLKWMLKHLMAAHKGYSFSCRIFVLSTGETETVYSDSPHFVNNHVATAVHGILAGDVAAKPSPWECPKCRHFLYCPA